jgi:hypothetical protein
MNHKIISESEKLQLLHDVKTLLTTAIILKDIFNKSNITEFLYTNNIPESLSLSDLKKYKEGLLAVKNELMSPEVDDFFGQTEFIVYFNQSFEFSTLKHLFNPVNSFEEIIERLESIEETIKSEKKHFITL